MKTMSVPKEECQYYDYPMAAALYEELQSKHKPQLCIIKYLWQGYELQTVGWCSEEDNDSLLDVPIFKGFDVNEEAQIIDFYPLTEKNVFLVEEQLYIVIALDEGLGIRRINLVFDESIARAVGILQEIPEIDYDLCKIYTKDKHKRFLGYYWVGKLKESIFDTALTMVILPVFLSKQSVLKGTERGLEAVALREGDTLIGLETLWQVSANENYGTCLLPIMEIPGGTLPGGTLFDENSSFPC